MLDRSNNTLRVKYLDRIEGYYLSSIETDENQVTYYEFINDEGEVIRIPEDQIDIKTEYSCRSIYEQSSHGFSKQSNNVDIST